MNPVGLAPAMSAQEAKKLLDTAFKLPGVRSPLTGAQRAKLGKKVVEPTTHERATIYLARADVLSKLAAASGETNEAAKQVKEAEVRSQWIECAGPSCVSYNLDLHVSPSACMRVGRPPSCLCVACSSCTLV